MYLWNHKKWTSFCILIHIFYFKDNVSHARVLFFVYAAQFLRLCPEVICPIIALSNRAEHLLIYRIQSHTYPKRRKFSLKQAGQKSVKEDLPEQRKAPKRAVECQLKVQTHIWDHQAGSSSLPSRTQKKDTTYVVSFFWGSGRRRRPPPSGIEMLRAAKPPFRQGFHRRWKRLYGAPAPPAKRPVGWFPPECLLHDTHPKYRF